MDHRKGRNIYEEVTSSKRMVLKRKKKTFEVKNTY